MRSLTVDSTEVASTLSAAEDGESVPRAEAASDAISAQRDEGAIGEGPRF